MIEDGRRNLVMDAPFRFEGMVRILAGGEDPDVPMEHVLALLPVLRANDVALHTAPDGDHRLSRPQDLRQLVAIASELRLRLAR
jgi:hypothetical protein